MQNLSICEITFDTQLKTSRILTFYYMFMGIHYIDVVVQKLSLVQFFQTSLFFFESVYIF